MAPKSPVPKDISIMDCKPVDSHIEGFVACAATHDDAEFADWLVTVGSPAGQVAVALCDFHAEQLADAISEARAA